MTTIDPAERERKRRRHRNERIVAAIVVVLVAIGAWAAVRWERRQRATLYEDRTYIPRKVTMTPEIAQLQELVRIDSSKPEGVAAAAKWVAAYLERNGVRAELIESAPNMVNVYARIEGEARGGGLLLFNHLDVVPAGEGWRLPPFDAVLFGDRMVGRGTVDMKALIICQLVAFVDIAKSGKKPAHDLVFLGTADEETGSRWGMQWLLANRPDVFRDVAYGITEGGITEMMREQITYFGIEVGGKQLVQVLVSARKREDLAKMRIALEPFLFHRQPVRVLPEVKRYLADLAPSRLQFREPLSDIDATIREGRFWQLPQTYRDLMQNTLSTGPAVRKDDRWEMLITMINLPDENPDRRVAWLAETIAPYRAKIDSVPVKEGPGAFSRPNTRLFGLLAEEARERYKVGAGTQVLYRSSSDSRFLRPRGIACYGVSPYPVTFFQSVAIHRQDESITLHYFQDGVDYLQNVVRAWAAE
jgi:acetylornithine deacetylase/succinyl-diaminopimelate desuccinylase-like protein